MPTDNPKISAYVPQSVYERFIEFRKDSGLSMSQSATVIFAKFFGLEDIAKEITGEVTADNSALDRIKVLESKVDDLFKKISELGSKPDSGSDSPLTTELECAEIIASPSSNTEDRPLSSLPSQKPDTSNIHTGNLLGELLVGLPTQIHPITGKTLTKRLILPSTGKNITSPTLSNENKKAAEDFCRWTMELDIDGIGWEYRRKVGYIPASELSEELQSRLLKWIEENS